MQATPLHIALAGCGALLLAGAAALASRVLPAGVPDTVLGLLSGLGVGALVAAAIRSRMPPDCDAVTPALRRRHQREFVPAAVAYAVLLVASDWLLPHVDRTGLRVLVALMPVPAMALALRAVVRYIRDADEMQRRIEVEAVSLASAVVALAYLATGYLQQARLIDIPAAIAMVSMLPLLCLAYALAKVAVGRRYR